MTDFRGKGCPFYPSPIHEQPQKGPFRIWLVFVKTFSNHAVKLMPEQRVKLLFKFWRHLKMIFHTVFNSLVFTLRAIVQAP